MKASARLDRYRLLAEAVVEQDATGYVHIHEPGRAGAGTVAGLVTGGLLRLVGGPAGLLVWAVGGGVLGGVAGTYLGRPIPEVELQSDRQRAAAELVGVPAAGGHMGGRGDRQQEGVPGRRRRGDRGHGRRAGR